MNAVLNSGKEKGAINLKRMQPFQTNFLGNNIREDDMEIGEGGGSLFSSAQFKSRYRGLW